MADNDIIPLDQAHLETVPELEKTLERKVVGRSKQDLLSDTTVLSSTDSAASVRSAAAGDKERAAAEPEKPIQYRTEEVAADKKFPAKQYQVATTEIEDLQERERKAVALLDKAEAETPPQPEAKPTRDQFTDEEAYIDSLLDWKIKQGKTEEPPKPPITPSLEAYDQELTMLRAENLGRFQERAKSLNVTPELLEGAKDINLPIEAIDALISIPNGERAGFYLLQHPDEARAIAKMPGHVAAARIAQLAVPPAPKPAVRKWEATKPVGGTIKSSVPIDELPYREYQQAREREIKARRGR